MLIGLSLSKKDWNSKRYQEKLLALPGRDTTRKRYYQEKILPGKDTTKKRDTTTKRDTFRKRYYKEEVLTGRDTTCIKNKYYRYQ